jgi:exosortase/archaeosortase family protein
MTVLAALYVHFTVVERWKKVVIFASSLLFAVVGNFVRIFSVVLFARLISVELATGLYHDYSGLIFFPIAVSAMVGFGKLLDRDWNALAASAMAPERSTPAPSEEREVVGVAPTERKPGGPISYDY